LTAETRKKLIDIVIVVVSVYLFLLSIKLLGHSFKSFGKPFAKAMLEATSNPFAGLFIGVVATSLIQSSSTTTSIVVGMVAAGTLSLANAIPIVMGANIGTTITNTLVSLGHITNRAEFRRAFPAGIVHDFFNVCAVIVLFPLELKFHIVQQIAVRLESAFSGAGGMEMFNPLKLILEPAISVVEYVFLFLPFPSILLLVFSVVLLFVSLAFLIRTIRTLVIGQIEIIIDRYLFRNDAFGFVFGIIMTAIVQSSSVTTSLIVPLAGAGIVRLRQIFPYTLGANIGTTVTAILAALATQSGVAVTVAFAHLTFNVLGIVLLYPFKFIPIRLAEFVGEKASKSNRNLMIFTAAYMLVYFIPGVLIFLT